MNILNEHTEWAENHGIRFQPTVIIHSQHTEQDNTTVLDNKPYVSGRVNDQNIDDLTEWNSTPEYLRNCTCTRS